MKAKFIILLFIIGLVNLKSKAQITDTVLTVSQNPFVSSTDLTIHNLTNDTVSLKIFSITGQVVKEYFKNIVLTGTFTVTFNASSLPNGVYFVNLKQNGENHNLKLIKNESLSVNKITSINKIKIYPNPTTDFLTISSNLKIKKLKIYDINGQIKINIENKQLNKINLQNLEKGMYLLYLKSDDSVFVKTVIKK